MTTDLPVLGIHWAEPYAAWTIARDPAAEARHGHQGHWYRASGADRPFPSVTTILSCIDKSQALLGWHQRTTLQHLRASILNFLAVQPDNQIPYNFHEALDRWLEKAAAEPDRVKNAAAETGTQIHKAIESVLLGADLQSQPSSCRPAIQAALTFLEDGELTPLAAETNVAHPEEHYAGQVDCIARHEDGSLVVIDWKSGGRLYPAYQMQTAAYAKALETLTGETVGHGYVVQVPKGSEPRKGSAGYNFEKVDDLEACYLDFHAVLTAWYRLQAY